MTSEQYPRRRPEAAFRPMGEEGGLVVLPTQRQVKVLNEVGIKIFSLLDGTHSESQIAAAVAAELGLHLVRDLTRDSPPPGRVLYTRVLGLGQTHRFGLGTAQRLASCLLGREEACVVLGVAGAVRGASQLRDAVVEAEAADSARF